MIPIFGPPTGTERAPMDGPARRQQSGLQQEQEQSRDPPSSFAIEFIPALRNETIDEDRLFIGSSMDIIFHAAAAAAAAATATVLGSFVV